LFAEHKTHHIKCDLLLAQRRRLPFAIDSSNSAYDKTPAMSSRARATRIARTNTAANASLSSDVLDSNVDRAYVEPEEPPTEKEILDELAKKACLGTSTEKKGFLLSYQQDYTAFAERIKPHDPALAERFRQEIPTKKQLG
jgi:hypothetical protein